MARTTGIENTKTVVEILEPVSETKEAVKPQKIDEFAG